MTNRILSVVGARPNFMKVAPIHGALQSIGGVESLILHTGQHYDARMSDVFFAQLGMPEPAHYLGIGGGSHAQQTARIISAFEPVLEEVGPDVVLVVGDVNSTMACALVAVKMHIPVVHVEAGLRSGDRSMPEEINRVVTDSISDLLFVTEQAGYDNLLREGIAQERIHFVGNVMIDSLMRFSDMADVSTIHSVLGLGNEPYVLVTLHRPSNVDTPARLAVIARMLAEIAEHAQVVFPCHPRTANNFKSAGLRDDVSDNGRIRLLEPLGYLEFLKLMKDASLVLTDSGGIQEETTFLGVPCLTVRDNTERPVTVALGTNELLPLDQETVVRRVREVLAGDVKAGTIPPLWDGKAAERIAEVMVTHYAMTEDAVSLAAPAGTE